MNKEIIKIVITGGPCAGKSTGMSKLEEELTKRGYKVLIIPETATELITSGIFIGDNGLDVKNFELAILKKQIAKEKLYEEAALKMKAEKVIILCDRGALDVKAYCSKEMFDDILQTLNMDEVTLRDEYDAIFHLKTAADGAEKFYTLANNAARSETLEQARELDSKIIKAWTGHPYFRIIDNSTDFNTKINRLLGEIFRFLGIPTPMEIERKYLIEMPDLDYLINELEAERIDIIQTYLKTDKENEEVRIRQRGKDGKYVYFMTTKKDVSRLTRIETEKRISYKEYLNLLMSADPELRPIRKQRYCFVYDNLYFELDIYPFWVNKAILEVELTDENQKFELPEFIKVIKDVTEDSAYRNKSLAKSIPS